MAIQPKSSVFGSIGAAIKRRFQALTGDIILSLRHALPAEPFFSLSYLINVVALRTWRGQPAAFTFELEESRRTPNPLVPRKPLLPPCLELCTQLWANNILKPVAA